MHQSTTQEQPTFDVSNIRRRRDGHFLIIGQADEIVLSLTERQMKIVLAVCGEESKDEIRAGLGDIVFKRTKVKLRTPVRRGGKLVYEDPVPFTPAERASLSRTTRRLVSLGLIDTFGGEVEPTEAGMAISDWVNANLEILGDDEELLFWTNWDEG